MKTHTDVWQAMLAVPLMSLALAGCGGGGDSGQGGSPEAAQATRQADGGDVGEADDLVRKEAQRSHSFVNGGFESGDYSGWVAEIPHGVSGFPPFDRPAGTVEVAEQFTFMDINAGVLVTRHADSGSKFLKIGTGNNEFFVGGGTYDISIGQVVRLKKGDTISGAAFYYNGDFEAQDSAWVRIFDDSGATLLATPWIEYSGSSRPGETNSVPYTSASPWVVWEWTAPANGAYTLKLGATTFGDNRFATFSFHDSIEIEPADKGKKRSKHSYTPPNVPLLYPQMQH